MAHNRFGARMWVALRNPWAVLLSTFGGALAWALGSTVPLSIGTGGVMLVTAVTVGAFTQSSGDSPLRPGTRQVDLVVMFDGHVRSLRVLHSKALPAVVHGRAEDALDAADAARPSVLQVAAAVDALDEAISSARAVSGQSQHAAGTIKKTVGRLKARRAALIERLTAAVDEVATVYAGLLELSATAHTLGVTLDDTEVSAVNDSVTLLQMTFAELEADAAALPVDGLM